MFSAEQVELEPGEPTAVSTGVSVMVMMGLKLRVGQPQMEGGEPIAADIGFTVSPTLIYPAMIPNTRALRDQMEELAFRVVVLTAPRASQSPVRIGCGEIVASWTLEACSPDELQDAWDPVRSSWEPDVRAPESPGLFQASGSDFAGAPHRRRRPPW